jgi:hypothetical protein
MRILIFIDAFSRFDSTQKGSIVRHTLRMFAASFSADAGNLGKDLRILAAHGHRSMSREYPQLKTCIIQPLSDTSSAISSTILRKNNQRDSPGREGLDCSNRSDFYKACLAWTKQRFDYQLIVRLSDNEIVRRFAVTAGIPCIVLREGYPSPYLYDSVVFELDREEPQCSSGDLLPFAALQRLLPVNIFEIALSPLVSRHTVSIYRSAEKNALIALEGDMNANTKGCASIDDVFNVVLPVLIRSGYVCYLLLSDARKGRSMRQHEYRAARRFCETSKNVVWLTGVRSDMDRLKLLAKMDVVVSRGSSSGYDAILMGKPVVLLERLPLQGFDNTISIQDLQREGFHQMHLNRCREYSLRMANLFLRRILVPKKLAFEKSYFMERVKRLCMQGNVAADREWPSTVEAITELMPEDLNRIRRQMAESYIYTQSGILKPYRFSKLHICSTKLDRMQRKWRKFLRDPLKFLLDSQHAGLKTVGALLEKI